MSPGAGTPTGTVTFKDGADDVGHGHARRGERSGSGHLRSTSSLAIGSHSITAVYGGDTNFTSSTSAAADAIGRTIGFDHQRGVECQPGDVWPADHVHRHGRGGDFGGQGTPTGTVTFKDGAATLGTGTLSVVNGVDQATFTTSSLAARQPLDHRRLWRRRHFTASTSAMLTQSIGAGGHHHQRRVESQLRRRSASRSRSPPRSRR